MPTSREDSTPGRRGYTRIEDREGNVSRSNPLNAKSSRVLARYKMLMQSEAIREVDIHDPAHTEDLIATALAAIIGDDPENPLLHPEAADRISAARELAHLKELGSYGAEASTPKTLKAMPVIAQRLQQMKLQRELAESKPMKTCKRRSRKEA